MATTKDKGPLADQVHPPDTLGYLNMLVYGHPGAGKTRLGGTADDSPLTSPVLFLDIDGGTKTLRNKKDIDVIQVRDPQHLKEIHDELRVSNNGHYKTVVIDSLTELCKLDMRIIMLDVAGKNPNQDVDVPSQREWGKSNEHIRRIVRAYRDLEMNTIFTAHMVESKDESTGQMTYYPSVPGKLKAEVPGFIDVVGYLYVSIEQEELTRVIQFQQSKKIIAKDRTDALGPRMVDPTIPAMMELINNSKGSNNK